MNKQRKTSHILNVFQYDANGHVGLPASLTLGIAPTGEDNSGKVPTTAWVRSIVGGAVTAYAPTSRTITINGTSYDLSSNRAWSIDTGVLTATAGSGISVSVVNQNLNIVNTGILTATAGSGISVSTVNQNLNIVNTGILTASAGLGISLSVVGQNLNVINTGILTASAGSGISLSVVGQNLNVVNTGILTATAGAGISLSVVNGNLNVVNTITNNNQLTNGAGYITSSALTGYATETYVGTQISNLVDAAPGTLDTLNELAAALGDDPNFATTVSTSIGTRVPQSRTISINGTSYDLSANRSWTINSMVYPSAGIAISTGTAWGISITDNSANWNTAFGWGNHASAGYLTSATAASTYVSLTGSYANPSWITSLAYSKITGVPAFLTSYTEVDTLASVTARGATTSTATVFNGGLFARRAQTAGNYTTAALWTESYDNTTTGIAFHISGNQGKFLEMRTDGVLYWHGSTVWHSGNLTNLNQLTNGPGYITSYTETDTLATVTARGASTSTALTISGVIISTSGSHGYVRPAASNGSLLLGDDSGQAARGIVVNNNGGAVISTAASGQVILDTQISGTSVLRVNGNQTVTILGNTVYHAGNLTNLNQLSNGPGYITGYTETDTLASVTGRGASTTSFVSMTGGSRIVVQNSSDGGNNRGIFMWNTSDPNWGIYMAQAGAGRALNDGTAPGGLDGRTEHAIRFRVAASTSQPGFIWENSNNAALMQLQPNTGNLYIIGRYFSQVNTASGLSNLGFNTATTTVGNIHIQNGAGPGSDNANQAAITFQGSDSSQAQAGIYVLNNNSYGTSMGFATTNSYAAGPQIFMTASNGGVVNFTRANPTVQGNGLWHAGNFNPGSYLPIGGSWYGVNTPGSRWSGLSVSGGEIVFGNGLPNAGQMGILIDGAYLAGENNGFWSLPSNNDWNGRRGFSWDGTQLNFTTNSPIALFSDVRATIFYDSNDTSFYLDPNAYSRLNRVGVGGAANDVSGININGDAGITSSNFFYFGHSNGSLGSWQTRTYATGGRQIWNTNGFEINRTGYGGGVIMYSDSSERVGFATSDFSYTASDNTAVVAGGISNNRVFVNGSIQLLNNTDAIVIGRGTSTFLKDEELGFGWGGGWFMEDSTWLRVRNNKSIYTTGTIRTDGEMRSPIYYDQNDTTYYGDFNGTSRFYQAIVFGDSSRYSAVSTTINGTGAGDKLILYGNTSNYDARVLVGTDYDFIFKSQGSPSGKGMFRFYSGTSAALAMEIRADQNTYIAGTTYSYAYRGHSNVAGTGEASFHPAGIYSTGTNWLYGTMYLNNNTIWDANNIYNIGWFRNYNRLGLYNQTQGGHFYQSDASYWSITGAGTSTFGLQFRSNYDSGVIGYVYGESSGNFGLLNGGSWAVRTTSGGGQLYGGWSVSGSMTIDGWYYTNGSTGVYFNQSGTGVWSPVAEGNPYGNISTYGTGRNGWTGYGVGSQFTLMGRTSTDIGLHDLGFGWIFYSPYATGRMGVGTSTTSSSYRLYVDGAIYATSDIVAYSDRRKKTNIVTIENALDTVGKMRGVFYDKIGEEEKGRQLGVIAQEVNEVLPEAVTYAQDVDEYGVKYGNMVGLLLEAIKEQQKQIEELQNKLDNVLSSR